MVRVDWNFCPDSPQYCLLFKHEISPTSLKSLLKSCIYTPSEVAAPPTLVSLRSEEEEEKLSVSKLVDLVQDLPKLISFYNDYQNLDKNHSVDPIMVANGNYKETWEGEPYYTTFAGWKGTLDYLCTFKDIQPQKMVVTKLLEIPHYKLLGNGIPNELFGSDHVSLMAEIRITEK